MGIWMREKHWLGWAIALPVAYGAMVIASVLLPGAGVDAQYAEPKFQSPTIQARPYVDTGPTVLYAEPIPQRDAEGNVRQTSWGDDLVYIEIVKVWPSNQLDADGDPVPDVAVRQTWTGPYGQGLQLGESERGQWVAPREVPGRLVWEN